MIRETLGEYNNYKTTLDPSGSARPEAHMALQYEENGSVNGPRVSEYMGCCITAQVPQGTNFLHAPTRAGFFSGNKRFFFFVYGPVSEA